MSIDFEATQRTFERSPVAKFKILKFGCFSVTSARPCQKISTCEFIEKSHLIGNFGPSRAFRGRSWGSRGIHKSGPESSPFRHTMGGRLVK